MRFRQIIILTFIPFLGLAQPTTPNDWGLKKFKISDKTIGEIGFYIDTFNIDKKAPIILYLNGSGGYPLCLYVKGDSSSKILTTFETNVMKLSREQFHFVLIDKPGLDFCDTLKSNEKDISELLESYKPPKYYNENLSLEWRVKSAETVISYLIKNGYSDKTKIIAWGFSEGGQVVPKLAAENKRITHLVSVVGSGLNQFYDNIISTRIKISRGEISHEQGQKEIEELFKLYKDIYSDKNSSEKEYWGHTYKRWASFGLENNISNLTKLTIPIYMLAGTADKNSPILGLDYVPLEFLRLGKTNLTYDVCIGCDHFQKMVESNDKEKLGTNLSDNYVDKILKWIENSK